MHAKGRELTSNDEDRRMLYELLAMFAAKNRCDEVLETVGLGGPMKPNDVCVLRGHTGLWFGLKGKHDILCNKPEREEGVRLVVECKGQSLNFGGRVIFRIKDGTGASRGSLGVTPTGEVRALERSGKSQDLQFIVQPAGDTQGTVVSGSNCTLRSHSLGKNVDVEGEVVRARTDERGTPQRLVMEKICNEIMIPHACSDRELTLEQQAWLLRRGCAWSLCDKQKLAKFLSGHKAGRVELLKTYAKLWEKEWRIARPAGDGGVDSRSGSPDSGASRRTTTSGSTGGAKRPDSRGRKPLGRLFDMFSGISAEDKSNGDVIMDALRSYFATALHMSQLEADCVQRVIEAFAEAMVNDKSFLDPFTASMLPEKDRKTYCTPEEVIFGLAYTTMMLNTDAHSQQVAQKMWDLKKFTAAGKDCGVTPGLMQQIFKNVQKEEL